MSERLSECESERESKWMNGRVNEDIIPCICDMGSLITENTFHQKALTLCPHSENECVLPCLGIQDPEVHEHTSCRYEKLVRAQETCKSALGRAQGVLNGHSSEQSTCEPCEYGPTTSASDDSVFCSGCEDPGLPWNEVATWTAVTLSFMILRTCLLHVRVFGICTRTLRNFAGQQEGVRMMQKANRQQQLEAQRTLSTMRILIQSP